MAEMSITIEGRTAFWTYKNLSEDINDAVLANTVNKKRRIKVSRPVQRIIGIHFSKNGYKNMVIPLGSAILCRIVKGGEQKIVIKMFKISVTV